MLAYLTTPSSDTILVHVNVRNSVLNDFHFCLHHPAAAAAKRHTRGRSRAATSTQRPPSIATPRQAVSSSECSSSKKLRSPASHSVTRGCVFYNSPPTFLLLRSLLIHFVFSLPSLYTFHQSPPFTIFLFPSFFQLFSILLLSSLFLTFLLCLLSLCASLLSLHDLLPFSFR